ncbi:hypothetical protein A2763_01240 [Candidatus Kaiserbacteria bacterium RIFCSPHIGHO2_01_FULL_54_36]|uniref:Uncharacterized protein n=1 Tax=Candidatus Kaiserbacteria bacterium RIFCSPHIGHO2_01_FULL_54_36 TaxID=1798482 RepID=A0A1F6CM02_9BACT|nr:MAG: hypothetical protein A2763_01240 [Candidatus Kaiserbacteria bacterium RIFCSPHIGHO2_01_FULL_54_36]OGG75744.1 MAG: hypothetical protein A3A41_00010 [Candidatus Kaiserbacteria bacterium RIFCSPLOWO2_01_FULL_54_22]
MGRSEPFAPPRRPFNFVWIPPAKNKKEWKAAGRGFEGARTRAPERITTESNRDAEYRTGTRAERARSVQSLEMSSRIV